MAQQQRRPRSQTCSDCGEKMVLSHCGVESHLRTRTRREQMEERCTGYVYIHQIHGGMDCWMVQA